MVPVVTAHVGIDVEFTTAAGEWTPEWGSTGVGVYVDPEAARPVEALVTRRADVFLAFLGSVVTVAVVFAGDGCGLAAWRWERLRFV